MPPSGKRRALSIIKISVKQVFQQLVSNFMVKMCLIMLNSICLICCLNLSKYSFDDAGKVEENAATFSNYMSLLSSES